MRSREAMLLVMSTAVVAVGCGDQGSVVDDVVPRSSSVEVPMEGSPATSGAPTTPSTTTTLAPVSAFSFPSAEAVSEWFVVNDTVMGGVSSGRLEWENGALVFTGDLSLDNNGGFASIRSPFLDPAVMVAWAERDGLMVEVGGDGRTWTMEVRTDLGDGGWISAIPTSAGQVNTVDVPWASFQPVTRFLDPRPATVPLDPARIVSVAFYLVDGIEAPFRLELYSIT